MSKKWQGQYPPNMSRVRWQIAYRAARILGMGPYIIDLQWLRAGCTALARREAPDGPRQLAASGLRSIADRNQLDAMSPPAAPVLQLPRKCNMAWGICPHCAAGLHVTAGFNRGCPEVPLLAWCPRCHANWAAPERAPCPDLAQVTVRDAEGATAQMCCAHAARALRQVRGLVLVAGCLPSFPPDEPDSALRHLATIGRAVALGTLVQERAA